MILQNNLPALIVGEIKWYSDFEIKRNCAWKQKVIKPVPYVSKSRLY